MSFSNCTGVSSGNSCPKALTSIFNHEEKNLFAFLGRFLFQLENFKDSSTKILTPLSLKNRAK